MTKIINNNIIQIDTKTGKKYYSTLYEVKRFISTLEIKWQENKIVYSGVFDKKPKKEIVIKQAVFMLRPQEFWKNFVVELELGGTFNFNDWSFEVEQFTKPEIIKNKI